jgi:hypothetical protein
MPQENTSIFGVQPANKSFSQLMIIFMHHTHGTHGILNDDNNWAVTAASGFLSALLLFESDRVQLQMFCIASEGC